MADLYPEHPILIVDDDAQVLKALRISLKTAGFSNLIAVSDSRDVTGILEKEPVELVLLDLMMPHRSGDDLLQEINENLPDIPVIIITAANDVSTAVSCMQHGAIDYIVKPVERGRLIASCRRAIEFRDLKQENLSLKKTILSQQLEHPDAFVEIITHNERMVAIFKYMEAVATSGEPVLITGETGTGKELFARAIHKLSQRSGRFISVNVAGLDDNIFSDTLFGHKRGAFTDALAERPGLIEQATDGTLFLDEIGDLGFGSQIKLLRLIQEKEFYPLGSDTPKRANIRLVFSTNQTLEELIQSGHFRKDLYFRIRTHHIHLPPLRERINDLPLLTHHFIDELVRTMGREKPEITEDLLAYLSTYFFPGNIRELRAMIIELISTSGAGKLSLQSFKKRIKFDNNYLNLTPEPEIALKSIDFASQSILPTLEQVDNALIEEALARSKGNTSMAARMIGLSRQTLSKRLKSKK